MSKKPAPKAKAKAAPPKMVPGVKHARKVKPSEAELLQRGRRLAASYLVQRDGMDEELAAQVIEGMEPEEINALIVEANTEVIEDINGEIPDGADFTSIPALSSDDEFAELVTTAANKGAEKNRAEIEYKAAKAALFDKLQAAGVRLDSSVMCLGVKATPYIGESTWLDEKLLMSAGVTADQIVKGRAKKKYNDVRILVSIPVSKEE